MCSHTGEVKTRSLQAASEKEEGSSRGPSRAIIPNARKVTFDRHTFDAIVSRTQEKSHLGEKTYIDACCCTKKFKNIIPVATIPDARHHFQPNTT